MNAKEDKAIRKQALEDYLTRRIHRGEVFIRYPRAEDGKPFACLVALRDSMRLDDGSTPILRVGWSKCSRRDQFDRKKALRIAVSRALGDDMFLSGTELISFANKFCTLPIQPEDFVAMALDARRYFDERQAKT